MARYFVNYFTVPNYPGKPEGSQYFGVEIDYPSGDIIEHQPQALNQRQRPDGRSAGSGRYVNRWVSTKGEATTRGDQAIFHYEGDSDYNPSAHYKRGYQIVHWDASHLFIADVECRYTAGSYHKWWVLNMSTDLNVFGPVTWKNRRWYINAEGAASFQYFFPLGPADDGYSRSDAISELEKAYSTGCYRNARGAVPVGSQIIHNGGYYADPVFPPIELKFSPEMAGFEDRADLLPHFGLDGAMARAFTDAVDGLPSLGSMNNIANGLDALALLKSTLGFIISPSIDDVGKVGDAWMGYRYAYSTTKADLEEAASYLERVLDLERSSHVRSNGTVHKDDFTVRCSLELTTTAFTGLRSKLEKYGLQLSGYHAWDMVPYSFVVDWFLDVGGCLEEYEARNIAYRVAKGGAWFSIERQWVNEYGFDEVYYYRYFAVPNLAWLGRTSKSTSTVTWLKRSLDALFMFKR